MHRLCDCSAVWLFSGWETASAVWLFSVWEDFWEDCMTACALIVFAVWLHVLWLFSAWQIAFTGWVFSSWVVWILLAVLKMRYSWTVKYSYCGSNYCAWGVFRSMQLNSTIILCSYIILGCEVSIFAICCRFKGFKIKISLVFDAF